MADDNSNQSLLSTNFPILLGLMSKLKELGVRLDGEIFADDISRKIYATDASAYREIPTAVVFPKTKEDIRALVEFATQNNTSLIPRTAGTSLAGQVVGAGIVVDVSRHFTRILEVNKDERWVRVQPGVVRDELNQYLKPYGLLFGPETSTANRAMVGGMVGNNSCGSNSIVYGSARDHLLEANVILSDGSEVVLGELSKEEFAAKCDLETLEGKLYRSIRELLAPQHVKDEIRAQFPRPEIPRRNTGYAIDLLLEMAPIARDGTDFNFCKLLAGSEGTLAFITELKFHVDPLPPSYQGLICAHFDSIYESLKATQIAVQHDPFAVELIDHFILECTKESIEHRKNRFFIEGDPQAIIVVDLRASSSQDLEEKRSHLINAFQQAGYGYHFPFVTGPDIQSVWNLRKAGLGLLSNIPGDAKPVPVIEDTAVTVDDLPEFIKEFNVTLKSYGLECVHYAHAGSGELHLRPILDLKTETGNALFRKVAEEIAQLVKKYKGSLSGEHGDGRLRGEFIPFMIGEKNFELIKQVKRTWDPGGIFNPGKIVDTPAMNTSLRYQPGQVTPQLNTYFDFSRSNGFVRSAEQCNGSGDCRKSHKIGGTMCPSFMATRNEKDTTRARANLIREVFTQHRTLDALKSEEIREVLDLCLSCKGCTSECPSNVDMARLKAEFTAQYQNQKGTSLRTRAFARISSINGLASTLPWLHNTILRSPLGSLIKRILRVAPQRDLPLLDNQTLRNWIRKQKEGEHEKGVVYLFVDEFTNFNETGIGKKAFKLLQKLGYEVKVLDNYESGRAAISKGMLKVARRWAERNVNLYHPVLTASAPLIGLEPSAILTFRDEYPDLVNPAMKKKALEVAKHVYLLDEFIARAHKEGAFDKLRFSNEEKTVHLHGHCHQKALSSVEDTKQMLEIPPNFKVNVIPSGCCGMAGSFGFEKEHYELSMQIGELVLFPAVNDADVQDIVAAPGTSCRHQIKDGTGRSALHPVEILYDALI